MSDAHPDPGSSVFQPQTEEANDDVVADPSDSVDSGSDSEASEADLKTEVDFSEDEREGKTLSEVAQECLDGKWGAGQDRVRALKQAGWDPIKVRVQMINLSNRKANIRT